jgi:hypothetical protein
VAQKYPALATIAALSVQYFMAGKETSTGERAFSSARSFEFAATPPANTILGAAVSI